MDLTQVDLESLHKNQTSHFGANSLPIEERKDVLGNYTFPIQITIQETEQTIMQQIHIQILREQVSEIDQVSHSISPESRSSNFRSSDWSCLRKMTCSSGSCTCKLTRIDKDLFNFLKTEENLNCSFADYGHKLTQIFSKILKSLDRFRLVMHLE